MKENREPEINIKVKSDGKTGKEEEVKRVDMADDEIARFEIESGRNSTQYVYFVRWRDGTLVAKLGIAGINYLARKRGGIQTPIDKLSVVEEKHSWNITMEAIDTRTNSSHIGTYIQSKWDEHQNPDPYAKQVCLSKARRNAIAPLLDDDEKEALIKREAKAEKKKSKTKPKKKVVKKKPIKKKVVKKKPIKKKVVKKEKVINKAKISKAFYLKSLKTENGEKPG